MAYEGELLFWCLKPARHTLYCVDGTEAHETFGFRPWVRRAGLSILLVATAVSAILAIGLSLDEDVRRGWAGEGFVWIYIGALWVGGAKVFLGTLRPVAEISSDGLTVRPLHVVGPRTIPWSRLTATEQMTRGDRMIIHYATSRGARFVAINLNLVKGRRRFQSLVDELLQARGFRERIEGDSRILARIPVENAVY
ncbi:MAG TPA: hypothetical protein VNM92_08780 [Thermoanaerobaculia bacterium]|nr:hypothetical protein [Thermoanaerobaculia bacterium]